MKTLATPTVHRNVENLRQMFLKVVGGDKHGAYLLACSAFPYVFLIASLKKLLEKNIAPHTIIFCNSLDSARSTEYTIKDWGFNATILHKEVPPKVYFRLFS